MCEALLERVNQNEFSINLLKDLSYIPEKKAKSPKERILNLFNATNLGNKNLTEAIGNAQYVYDEAKEIVDVYKLGGIKFEKPYVHVLTQREVEYTDFLCFIDRFQDYDFAIIPEAEYNNFYADEDKEEMDMKIVESSDFYEAFEKDIWSFEDCFVSSTYTDERENQVYLAIMINGEEKKFIVDIS